MARIRLPVLMLALCLAPGVPIARAQLAPEVLALARIKQRATAELSRLRNYTCLQTIYRSERPAHSSSFRPLDTVRVEVANVDGQEMYAWPGRSAFGEQELGTMLGWGMVSTGAFISETRNLFQGRAATFQYRGEQDLAGRRALKYEFRIEAFHKALLIVTPRGSAWITEHGFFWVDAQSLQLIRISCTGEDPPVELDVEAMSRDVEYAPVQIGATELLLPSVVEVRMTDASGKETRNRTRFSNCREYTAQSVISFDPLPEAVAPVAAPAIHEIELPAGLVLEMRLETPLNSEKLALGDPIEAKLEREIKRDGEVLVPAGGVLRGRIAKVQRVTVPNQPAIFVIGMRFSELESGSTRALLSAELQKIDQPARVVPGSFFEYANDNDRSGRRERLTIARSPGVSVIVVRANHFQLPRGLRLVCRTTQR